MTGVYRFVGTVVVLIVLEAVVVATVVLVPDARLTLTQAASDTAAIWLGSEERQGNFEVFTGGFNDFYAGWLQPLAGPPATGQAADDTFSECIACHSDYSSKTKFTTVLMDHPLHAELGVGCGECHTDIAHPLPLPPSETVCAGCHPETNPDNETRECALCHSPGTLTHYQEAGIRESSAVDCNTCHLPGSLGGTATHSLIQEHRFNGEDEAICMNCHQSADCGECHGVDHPDDWISEHGPDVLFGSTATCNNCHSGQWCAGACHDAGTLYGDRLLPLPSGGDE